MNRERLIKYIEISEQIKALTEVQDEIKAEIKELFPQGGVLELDGIRFGTDVKSRSDIDKDKLRSDFGADIIDRYKTLTAYLSVFVKVTTRALK